MAPILKNEPIKLHAAGTKVLTTLSRQEDLPNHGSEKALRYWAQANSFQGGCASFKIKRCRRVSSSTR
jgi:hypothetical protein